MGWTSYLNSGNGTAATNALDPLNITGAKQGVAEGTIAAGADAANAAIQSGTQAAQGQLTAAGTQGQNALTSGYNNAREATTTGYGTASQQLATGGANAVNTAQSGFNQAQADVNQAPNMVQSRQDLYQRLLGNGGLSPDVMNQIEAKTNEAYGTGLRGAEQATSQFLGDSEARGLAGEEVAQAAASLGSTHANAIRDAEIQNAQLARTEQTSAITSAMSDAYQQAGLDAQSAEYVSGLQEKIAEGASNLTASETNALSSLAASEGTSVASLVSTLAQAGATLSASEAQALANVALGSATNTATVQTQSHGLGSLLGM